MYEGSMIKYYVNGWKINYVMSHKLKDPKYITERLYLIH